MTQSIDSTVRGLQKAVRLFPVRDLRVKTLCFAAFDGGTVYGHKELANLICAILPGAGTSHKSVASIKVDWSNARRSAGVAPASSGSRGQVREIVHAMFEQGGYTAQQIADEVRRRVPSASTTHKSVASMKVDWKRDGGTVTKQVVEMTADMLGL